MSRKILAVLIITAMLFAVGCAESNPAGDASGVKDITNTTAREIVADMRIGWNLGNTFDAYGDTPEGFSWLGDGTFAGTSVEELETAWLGEDAIGATRELFNALKEAGFNAVRIPVTWCKVADADNNYAIRADWMARVKEVVDYAVANDMYIILNTHHEESLFKFLDGELKEYDSLKAFELIWRQIAETFRDYDEKLIFEGLNEPRTQGSRNEWIGGTKEERVNINTYNQIFVDTVRATGGNNAYRALMITPYGANSDSAAMKELKIPKDSIADRIIVSIHAYTPWEFALRNDDGAVDTWSRNNRGDTSPIHHMFNRIYDEFLHDGIPVIMGEMGAVNRDNIEDRADWAEFYVSTAKKFGVPCFWWDNGIIEGDGELFGLIDRHTSEFYYPEIVRALMRATHPTGERAFDFAEQRDGQLTIIEPDVGDDGNRPDEDDSGGLPTAPTDEPKPEPYTGSEISISYDNGFSLIADEETELTTELKELVNRFNFPLLPADIEAGIIQIAPLTMTRIYQDYVSAGLIEPFVNTNGEDGFIISDGLYFEAAMKVDNINFILDDIFSNQFNHTLYDYHGFITSDGIFGYGAFGITSGYRYILMGQEISEEVVELYFYLIYDEGFALWRKGYKWHENMDDGVIWLDRTVIGEWEHVNYIGTGNIILYEDLFDTLDIVKYTFILEDGRYKILSIENAA